MLVVVFDDGEGAVAWGGVADFCISHAEVVEQFAHLELVFVAHLDDDAGVFGEERLHQVFLHIIKVDAHAAGGVGEAHLEQRGEHAAGADVVACHHPSLANHLLDGVEATGEIFCVMYGGDVVAHLAQGLCQGRTTEAQVVETEVDVVDGGVLVVDQHGRHHLADVAHLAAAGDDDGARGDDFLTVGILLAQREGVLARGDVDAQLAAELAKGFHCVVESGVLAFLRAARPHPVGGEGYTLQTIGQRRPHDVGERLGNRQHAALLGGCQPGLRGMSQCGGDAFPSLVVESHHAAVGERQLQLSLALLACDFARHGAVDLVGEPVLARDGFKLQDSFDVFIDEVGVVGSVGVVAFHGAVHHDRLRGVAEHLSHIEVEGSHAVGLLEGEVGVARCLSHHVQGCALALGDACHMFDMFLVDEQSHALLALVGDDFLCREGGVADGEGSHVDFAAAFLHQFGETVEMSSRTVVVDAHHGVDLLLAECSHEVVGAFLHFGVGALHGVEFDAVGVTAGVHGGY